MTSAFTRGRRVTSGVIVISRRYCSSPGRRIYHRAVAAEIPLQRAAPLVGRQGTVDPPTRFRGSSITFVFVVAPTDTPIIILRPRSRSRAAATLRAEPAPPWPFSDPRAPALGLVSCFSRWRALHLILFAFAGCEVQSKRRRAKKDKQTTMAASRSGLLAQEEDQG